MKSHCHGDPRRTGNAADFLLTSIVRAIPNLNWESRENKGRARKAEEAADEVENDKVSRDVLSRTPHVR